MNRVVIIEHHAIVRDALLTMFRNHPLIAIVGAAGSIQDGLPTIEHAKPDLALVGLSLEDGSGIELARVLRRSQSRTRVLIMTAFRDEFSASEALAAGVAGYLLKEQPTADLVSAIETVIRGKTYISPIIAARLRPGILRSNENSPLARLSPRETEVFRLAVAGSDMKDIARRLFISVKTVGIHRTNINRKLNVRTIGGLIRFAAAHGIAIAQHPSPGVSTTSTAAKAGVRATLC